MKPKARRPRPATPRAPAPSRKPWAGRFTREADPAAERFTGSLAFDRRLWPHDVAGSIAWARALARAGVLTPGERDAIVRGLEAVRGELAAGTFPFRPELEDIHMNVERRLQELVGEVGGKLHTGRSRNDQIALDERLYLREVVASADEWLRRVEETLVARAAETVDAPLPGYTHLQRAQPIVLAHHLLAYVFMLERDRGRLRDCGARADALPLGAGALAGTAFPVDREALARDLGFRAVTPNSLDAVSDRDYLLEFLAAAALTGMHLSRLATDLTLWATAEFGFVEFSDAFATGSSIMPQKKNPDAAELIRGKSGRLYGNLVAVLTTLKGLPLAYNSDMQEDKEPFFDSVDTLEAVLAILPPMLASLTFRTDRMRRAAGEHFATATDLADYLVRKGLPFRQAHAAVGRVVRYALDEGKALEDLGLAELRRFSPLIEGDVKDAITV
ncbi:MAG: argininosuccinate lyase, partial [Candidatus Rokubacteria bacterium GWA2_73_35]